MTDTPTKTDHDGRSAPGLSVRGLIGRITRLEIIVGAAIAAMMLLLVVIEPEILEAPFQNWRTLVFTFGGTALAAVALVAMLRFSVPPVARVGVLVVPFAIVNWWLISPYFVDDVVDETFSVSISDQLATADETPATTAPEADEPTTASAPPTTEATATTEVARGDQAPSTGEPPAEGGQADDAPPATEVPNEEEPPPTTVPGGPVLLGAGRFVGLAGHSGTGDAGIFENPDGSLVLRFENFDIQNGPDLEVYLVPGSDQTSLAAGSIHLGALKGNVGDQNYDLPAGTDLAPGAYTALVWCEAFSVEFVGATIEV
ncbi:MAG TPA: DM13 domain-containing protein [Acidimicrobiia bacterium]|nr:DM13 domain-containing protein [Acidimicrobiia bacterium]